MGANDEGRFPLLAAVAAGDMDEVRRLVEEEGEDVTNVILDTHASPPLCFTALGMAARQGSVEIVRYLLSRGADANFSDLEDQSILTWLVGGPYKGCTREKALAVAQLLIDHGADVSLAGSDGLSPLLLAIGRGFKGMRELLEKNGAKLDMAGIRRHREEILVAAARHDYGPLVRLIAKEGMDMRLSGEGERRAKGEGRSEDGRNEGEAGACGNLLTMAAAYGSSSACLAFLKAGVEPDVRDGEGSTPLFYAAQFGMRSVARALVAAGADVNNRDGNGMTPMHGAAIQGDVEIARLLKDAGADLEAKNELGHTPLHVAAVMDRVKVARWLVENGACVEGVDEEGRTPFMEACAEKSLGCVEFFLERHVDRRRKDIHGWDAQTLLTMKGTGGGTR